MRETQPGTDDVSTRRKFLVSSGAVSAVALAGCIGDAESDAGSETSGGSGGTGSDSPTYPDFDPDNPEFPQSFGTLMDANLDSASLVELDEMEVRDEPRYGNPVQELGADEEPIRPDPLVFTWAPTEDPAGYEDTFDVLRSNLEAELDVDVETFVTEDYASQVEAMRAERLHVARFATGNTPYGVNLAGAQPFAMPVEGDQFGVRVWTVARADNDDINSPADLAGLDRVAHGSPTSNSGNLAPTALLPDQGVTPGEDYEIENTGSHENVIMSVVNNDFEAGNGCSTCMFRALDNRGVDLEDIKVVWASDAFPLGPISLRYNLAEDIKQGVRNALMDYDYEGTPLDTDIGYKSFVEIDYATHWDTVLQIQEFNDVEYRDSGL